LGATFFDRTSAARSWRTSAELCLARAHPDILGIETASLKIRSSAKGSFCTGATRRNTFKTNNCFQRRSNSHASPSIAKNIAPRRTFYTQIVATVSSSALGGEFWSVHQPIFRPLLLAKTVRCFTSNPSISHRTAATPTQKCGVGRVGAGLSTSRAGRLGKPFA
jgi:hypothetical protein